MTTDAERPSLCNTDRSRCQRLLRIIRRGHGRRARWRCAGLLAGGLALLLSAACDEGTEQKTKEETASPVDAPSASVPDAPVLASFQALYTLSLAEANPLSNIDGYEGLLILSLETTCDGYVTNQRITAQVANEEGEVMLSDFVTSSWEALDATAFHYNLVNRINNRVVKEVDGKAERRGPGAAGEVHQYEPEDKTFDLPASVLFPTQYSLELLKAAAQGETVFEAEMFDGSDDTPIYSVVSFIGKRHVLAGEEGGQAEEEDDTAAEFLAGHAYWPVQIGYHAQDSVDAKPKFELGMRMYDNGVGTHLVLDYGDLKLVGELKRFEPLSMPECSAAL